MDQLKEGNTPLIKQYYSIKIKYPNTILLFQVGDFYETFGEDAIKCSKLLDIVLTKRSNGGSSNIDLAGFPHHVLDNYLPKLISSGLRIAICNQLEDSKKDKNIIKRGVTELVTPGIIFNDHVLKSKYNNFLGSIYYEKNKIGLAFLDVSTGEFFISEGIIEHAQQLIHRLHPSEIIHQKQQKEFLKKYFKDDYYTYVMEDWVFDYLTAYEKLIEHFQTKNLKGFGIETLHLGIISAAAILYYLSDTQHDRLKHILTINKIEENEYVWIDDFTLRNLEIISSINEKGIPLINILDKTISSMGGRLFKRWISLPLKDITQIKKRNEIVSQFFNNSNLSKSISEELKQISDIERLISKIAIERINPREVIHLYKSLEATIRIKNKLISSNIKIFKRFYNNIQSCDILREYIMKVLNSEPSYHINKGNVIRKGFSKELDSLRELVNSKKDYLEKLCKHEKEKTGINSLKISFNYIFGYYIEVRNIHKHKVPITWIRKQTLSNSERYITEELKEYEKQILGAEDKILILETQLFQKLVKFLSKHIKSLQLNAKLIANIDVLNSLAICAIENNYVKPELNESLDIYIENGRHPVIEKHLPLNISYISNSISLNQISEQIIIITGPNMSGKSAILRQTVLIILMAQIGSYVPAKYAKIGIVDKIFSRVGASDNISIGESTFMVEMNETANILNNISSRSLIILDEIGRGTSTYDGISIAWAIVEYLHENPSRPKTLFATHYHELNEMCYSFKRIKNYNVLVKNIDNNFIFMHKLVPGGSSHSFGIHVAKLAGMPIQIINRSIQILNNFKKLFLYKNFGKKDEIENINQQNTTNNNVELKIYEINDCLMKTLYDQLINIDLNIITPLEALIKLNEIKKKLI